MSHRPNKKSGKSNQRVNAGGKPKQESLGFKPEKIETFKTAEERLEEIHSKNIAKAKELAVYESSSEEEELDRGTFLANVFRGYSGERNQLVKTQNILEETLQSGSAICLICIGSIKRNDSIWSCLLCYCIFHLNCVKKWANDSIFQQKSTSNEVQRYYNNSGELILKVPKLIRWCCPKCRTEYEPEEVPREYTCFCTKEINPQYQQWLVPHSCGETCSKLLKPECGHKCMLLCHPGPCPPCPQNVVKSCLCEKSPFKTIRCFQKTWKCNVKCGQLLKCKIHVCEQICHPQNYCPPCTKKSIQKCLCGKQSSERKCSELVWQCNNICNKLLQCGRHKCEELCHKGECAECPLGLPRACPCGKTKSVAPCSDIVEPCGDTCQKALPCGLHFCTQRCHKGECSPCLIFVEKKCRCGLHTKEMPCSKQFTCETKCKYKRECGKHVCSKKCCDGNCPPCDKVCGKLLSCRKHKCQSICHDGPCYPCQLQSTVKCRCGSSCISVPCGREKKTRPPKCNLPCKFPSKCHHTNPHFCHMAECPPCTQTCNLENDISKCQHPCQAKCHTAVRVINTQRNTANIWSLSMEEYIIKKMPHPRCEVKISVVCIGGHETEFRPCWDSKPRSCGRLCGRTLSCGNHKCEKICHAVADMNNIQQQVGCMKCELGCIIPRPNGCVHPCRRSCHLPRCVPCSVTIKTACHCGLTQVYYKCIEFYQPMEDGKILENIQEKLKSCGNPCIKTFPCGHSCTSVCHSGDCPNPENCQKKVKVYCNCKTYKIETTCNKQRAGLIVPCNEKCMLRKQREEEIKMQEEAKKKLLEEERNRLELEQFEKKFGKKKPREKRKITENKETNYSLKIWIISASFVVITSIILVAILYR